MTYAYPATVLRGNFAGIIRKIREEGSTCLITQKGRATAVLLPLELYNRMLSDLEDWLDENDQELVQEIHNARREFKAKKFKTLNQILK